MSRPRDNWRPYVINVLRDYYSFRRAKAEAHGQRITAQFKKGRGGGGTGRSTEEAALRCGLTRQQERELDAVERAVRATSREPDGRARLRVVELVYFRGTHTIEGAAKLAHVSYITAWRWCDRFIRRTGENLGLE